MTVDREGPAPWERQPGESARAYAAFCLYRDMPPSQRSLRAVAEALGYIRASEGRRKSVPGRIVEWSRRWRWTERAQAWDDEKDRRDREAQLQAIKEMRERHATQAMYLQQKAIEALKQMSPQAMSPGDILRYLIEAAKLERISRGEPETIQETRSSWVDAVLAAWERRQQQVAAEGAEDAKAEPAGEAGEP